MNTHGALALLGLAIAVAANLALAHDPSWRTVAWLLTIGGMTTVIVAAGLQVNGQIAGVIIDDRNRVSLSRLQMVLWTVLVLSALATAAAANLSINKGTDALCITIPPELLMAMGIAAVSLTATPALLSLKTNTAASEQAVQQTAARLNVAAETVPPMGNVFARSAADDALWIDIFRGDDVSTAASPDLSKIQQFLVTVLLVVIYGFSIAKMLADPSTTPDPSKMCIGAAGKIMALPALSESFIWLLGISHASYLTYKAVPHGGGATSDPRLAPSG